MSDDRPPVPEQLAREMPLHVNNGGMIRPATPEEIDDPNTLVHSLEGIHEAAKLDRDLAEGGSPSEVAQANMRRRHARRKLALGGRTISFSSSPESDEEPDATQEES